MFVWTKSSYCGSGQCVEVARGRPVRVRDSRGDDSPILVFEPGDWRAFVTLVGRR